MNEKNKAENNCLKISEDVIARIVEIAVKGIDGVVEFTKSRIRFSQLFVKSDTQSAIDIHTENGAVDINVSVIVSYGCRVKQVAERIQRKIKDDVQNMTGIAVTKVNVAVDGISFENAET